MKALVTEILTLLNGKRIKLFKRRNEDVNTEEIADLLFEKSEQDEADSDFGGVNVGEIPLDQTDFG